MESFKEVKFILLGDGNVGKTCLMLSFTGKAFRVSHINTIGIDMEKKIVDFDGSALQVTIWDTAGQERYRNSIPKNIFKRLNGALLVFDVTNRRSFNSMNSWIKLIEENAPQNTALILVGNKIDREIVVAESEGRTLANSFAIPFVMTSAKNGTNVEQAFSLLLKLTQEKNPVIFESVKHEETIELKNPKKTCGNN